MLSFGYPDGDAATQSKHLPAPSCSDGAEHRGNVPGAIRLAQTELEIYLCVYIYIYICIDLPMAGSGIMYDENVPKEISTNDAFCFLSKDRSSVNVLAFSSL